MRIDCGECGEVDHVWASKIGRNLPDTLEVGNNHVTCRKCKAHGWVELDVTCKGCGGKDLWRWPGRSMDCNSRRWMCRDCNEVSECFDVAILKVGVMSPAPQVTSRPRTWPPCPTCGGLTDSWERSRSKFSYCMNTNCNARVQIKIHRAPRVGGGKVNQGTAIAGSQLGTSSDSFDYLLVDEPVTPAKPLGWQRAEWLGRQIAAIRKAQKCSVTTASMLAIEKWEALDDEAILCI